MNYIHALVARNKALEAEVAALRAAADDFKCDLILNPKYHGYEPDGSRKDWISVRDALNRIRNIEMVERANNG